MQCGLKPMSKVDGSRRSKTGGRKKGTPNKATAEIKEIAHQYGADCIEILWALARRAKSGQAKVAAMLPSLFQRMSASMPRTARFILHSCHVVKLLSCP